ncbi:MAG: FUSC family protein [Dokdonella sp.]
MLRELIELKPRDVPLRVALRNAAAIVLPLGVGIASGHVGIGLGIAVGALTTMFSDQPGPYRLRMQRMLLTALIAGVSALVGSLVGANLVLAVLAALVWGVGGGLLVALGTDAGRAGLTSMILLVITSSQPRTPSAALAAALLIFCGGALQTLFAIAAWPLQRYRPERHALAEVCRQLAGTARHKADPTQAPPVTQALLAVESLLHGRHRARGEVMDTFRVLAELVERIRLELLALGDIGGALVDGEAKVALTRVLQYAAQALDALAGALERGISPVATTVPMEGFAAAVAALAALRGSASEHRARRALSIALARAQGLGGQLRAALRNAQFAGSLGDLGGQVDEARRPRALRPRSALATLRANLGFSSVAFRHALRCGVCLALAVGATRIAGFEHGYWVAMTTAIVLKPDFAGTLRIGLLRVIGTLLGLVLTTALVHYAFGSDWERLALLAIFCIAFRMLVTMHYGLAVMMLTSLVVILLAFEGMAPDDTMLARGIATVIGSGFALTAYALWPTWERQQVRPALAAMLDAYRAYFDALLHGDSTRRVATRTRARSTRTNAQASLERLRGEPRPDPALTTLAAGIFANANRCVRACMALEAAWPVNATPPQRDDVLAFAARIDAALGVLAASLRQNTVPAIDRLRHQERMLAHALDASAGDDACGIGASIADAFDRMTDSIDTLAYLLRTAAPVR